MTTRDDAEHPQAGDRFLVGLAAVTTMIRERDNLSKRELARRAGIGRPLVSNIENCRANPTTMCLVRLAKGLGLSGLGELASLADESARRIEASVIPDRTDHQSSVGRAEPRHRG